MVAMAARNHRARVGGQWRAEARIFWTAAELREMHSQCKSRLLEMLQRVPADANNPALSVGTYFVHPYFPHVPYCTLP